MSAIARSAGGVPPQGARLPVRAGGQIVGIAALLIAVVIAGAAARGSVVPGPEPLDAKVPGEIQQPVEPVVQAGDALTESAAKPSAAAPDAEPGPVRLTGAAGENLNAALAAAGVSETIAQDYLRALAVKIELADGISIADRFDLVIERASGGGGKASERLLYAGLDRVGASDVMLMRWTAEGKSGWMDASGTGGAAEAMRMPVAARVSSSFGMRRHPILQSHRFHRGIDLKAAWGTPIRASADGRVAYAGWNGGYGRQVSIGHAAGLTTTYAHMSRIAARPGGWVRRGEIIGYVGSSGLSTGPHVHYEVLKNGRPVNPLSVRYAGNPGLDREERTAFNARLRQLLTAGRS